MADGLSISLNPCSAETLAARQALNRRLEAATNSQIQWHECDTPQAYRDMRRNGTNGFPKPVLDPGAEVLRIPSSFGAHEIPLRIIKPASTSGRGDVKGVMLHYHGGGLVYGSADGQDKYLAELATDASLAVVSVEYRLAPENPFPAAGEDALDALRFAISEAGQAKLGGKLLFVAGESSGAYLATWSVLKLRDDDKNYDLKTAIPGGMLLSYGIYDLSGTPSVDLYTGRALVGGQDLKLLTDAAFPLAQFSIAERKHPHWSPLYADLKSLPPALFLVGTDDPALDDSVFMAARWSLAGNQTKLKVIPAACHALTLLPMGDAGGEGRKEMKDFIGRFSA